MSQIAYIKNVKLKNLSSTLALFMKWNDDGVHNFHMLPYGVKGPLTVEEEEQILSSRERYGGKAYHLRQYSERHIPITVIYDR